jgi:hypothetical protein
MRKVLSAILLTGLTSGTLHAQEGARPPVRNISFEVSVVEIARNDLKQLGILPPESQPFVLPNAQGFPDNLIVDTTKPESLAIPLTLAAFLTSSQHAAVRETRRVERPPTPELPAPLLLLEGRIRLNIIQAALLPKGNLIVQSALDVDTAPANTRPVALPDIQLFADESCLIVPRLSSADGREIIILVTPRITGN